MNNLENKCIDLLNRVSKLYTSNFNDIKLYKFKIVQSINEIKLLNTNLAMLDSLWAKNYFVVLTQEQNRLEELLNTVKKLEVGSPQGKAITQVEKLNSFKQALKQMEDSREKN